jgi:hypothetical protein
MSFESSSARSGSGTPPEGILDFEGLSLRPLGATGYSQLEPILRGTPDEVLELPPSEAAFRGLIRRVTSHPWGMPMVGRDGDEAVALFMLALPSAKNLHASVVSIALQPASRVTMLALYLRHAFWSFPLHRIFTELPVASATAAHEALYANAGFVREGFFKAHYLSGGTPTDVSILGLLRPDFDAWCAAHEPRLSLAQ